MKAIIYAAGKSPRLLPLTKDLPVSLLKIKDKTILDFQLEVLNHFNFSEIIIITGFQAKKIEALKLPDNVKLFFDPYYEISNIPPSLHLLKDQLKEGFVFLYSDVLFQVSVLKKLIDYKNSVVLAVDATYKGALDEEAEKVIIDDGLVSKLSKISISKEASDGEFIGLAKFTSKIFPQIEKTLEMIVRKDLKTSFIHFLNLLIDFSQPIHCIEVSGNSWMEIDFPEDLERAKDIWGSNLINGLE